VEIVNFDKLTYAGNPESLADIASDHRIRSFVAISLTREL